MSTELIRRLGGRNKMVGISARIVLHFVAMLSFGILLSVASCSNEASSTMTNQSLRQHARPEPVASPEGHPLSASAEPTYEGEYRNEVFGFRVVIPDGLEGKGSPEPAPQHGFLITLSAKEQIAISVEGNYNAPLWSSLDAAFTDLSAIDPAKNTKLLSQGNSLLDGRPARWFVVQYTSKETEGVRVKKEIISMRACPEPQVQVIYTLTLDTSETRFQQDNLLLEKLIQSWKLLKYCG